MLLWHSHVYKHRLHAILYLWMQRKMGCLCSKSCIRRDNIHSGLCLALPLSLLWACPCCRARSWAQTAHKYTSLELCTDSALGNSQTPLKGAALGCPNASFEQGPSLKRRTNSGARGDRGDLEHFFAPNSGCAGTQTCHFVSTFMFPRANSSQVKTKGELLFKNAWLTLIYNFVVKLQMHFCS